MMATSSLDELAVDYFASISGIAFKLQQDCDAVKALYADTWNDLSWEKQEQLLDEHIIHQSVLEKYADVTPSSEQQLDCFPVLKINSGEKIVVDFEHEDGWTWTDEHSAPFSWRSKSQQDLRLADLDDIAGMKDDAVKKARVGGGGGIARPRSPDRIVSGLSLGDKNEVEMMFEKFGIKAKDLSTTESPERGGEQGEVPPQSAEQGGEQGEVSPQNALSPSHLYNETSKLLAEFGDGKSNGPATPDGPPQPSKRKKSAPRAPDVKQGMNNSGGIIATESHNTGVGKNDKGNVSTSDKKINKDDAGKSRVKDKVKANQEKDGHRKERGSSVVTIEGTVEDVSKADVGNLRMSETGYDPALNVKLYIQEPGESSTDDIARGSVTAIQDDVFMGENWTSQSSSIITTQPRTSDTASILQPVDAGSTVKTGFDFLDDW